MIFVGCTKEGPVGPQGVQGARGIDGQDGSDGNANVKTEIITISPSAWITSGNTLYVIKYLSIITYDIAEYGVVLVYWKSTGSSSYQALPLTWPGTDETIYRFWSSSGQIELSIYQENGPPAIPTSTYTYKVVAIESELISKVTNVDFNNYNEVKEYFNLID